MVHSTWSSWFVQDEIEAATVDGLSVWYLGCNGFVCRTPTTTLYIDPYFAEGNPPRIVRMIPVPMHPADATECDAVLVTHEHIDHMHPPSVEPLVSERGTTVHAPEASYEQADYDGDVTLPDATTETVAVGAEFEIGDITVSVHGANDPDAIEPVTYVLQYEDQTFFHAGDSRPSDNFAELGEQYDIDLGVLAFGSVGNIYDADTDRGERTRWYMDENQVIEAANDLQIERLFPSHWDMWRGVGADPKVLHEHAASFEYPRTVEVGKIGDRVDVGSPGVVRATDISGGGR